MSLAYQLTVYLEPYKLLPECQPGFLKGHSTETLVLRLLSDIYGIVESSQITLLALFDVSAAFDAVFHKLCLIKRLEISLRLFDNFLRLMSSFLAWRAFPLRSQRAL